MKKIFATVSLGALLVAGFMFAQDNEPTDTAMDLEPTVFSMSFGPSMF